MRWIANTVIGNTVWVVTGERRSPRFLACLAFTANDIVESHVSGFEYRVGGHGIRIGLVRIWVPWKQGRGAPRVDCGKMRYQKPPAGSVIPAEVALLVKER